MNSAPQLVELVKVVCRDGLRLDGVYESPAEGVECQGAVICLHGAASNFYGGTMFERLSPLFRTRGWGVLRVNTRGHDGYFATRTAAGAVRLGAAYERVGDCTLDVTAWVNWVVERGLPRTLVLGHSLGAIKAVYSQAYAAHERVTAVLALSPPRLSGRVYRTAASSEFLPMVSQAEQLVAAGRPQAVIESTFPFPMLITAEAFLEKYAGETYNLLEFVHTLQVPVGFLYGERELDGSNASFAGLPAALAARVGNPARLRVEVIPDADHFYSGCYEPLEQSLRGMLDWLGGAGVRPQASGPRPQA